MASMAITGFLPKLSSVACPAIARRSRWGSRVMITSASRPPQGNLGDDAQKSVAEEVGSAGEVHKPSEESRGIASASVAAVKEPAVNRYESIERQKAKTVMDQKQKARTVMDQVTSGVNSAAEGAKDMASATASQVAQTTQDIGDKAKQLAQEAWGTAKETVEKVKDTVVGKAEETKENIRDNAEAVKRAMNTKN